MQFTVPIPIPAALAAGATFTPPSIPTVPQMPSAGLAYAMAVGVEDGTGKTCALLSIIFGCVAFLFCPIVFGLAGIVLGIIGVTRCQKKKLAITGLVLSVVGMIAGMIIGVLVAIL